MSFKMKGFNKQKSIDDSSIFKSKANLMIRNAALFQAGKEVSGRKSYFRYEDDSNVPTGMKYQGDDKYDDDTGYFTPKEISARYAQNKEGAMYDERPDGTNKFSDYRGGLIYADDKKTIIRGYKTDDGKVKIFQSDAGGDYARTRREFKGRNKRELEDFEREVKHFNNRRATDRENFRRLAEYADAGGKLSMKPDERYIPYEEKKKLMEKNKK